MRLRTLLGLVFLLFVVATQVRGCWVDDRVRLAIAAYSDDRARVEEMEGLVDRLRVLSSDLETGLRGWQLTRERAFLTPYERARDEIRPTLARLRMLVRSPELVTAVEEVERRLSEWSDAIARPMLELGVSKAEEERLTREGKDRMDGIRAALRAARTELVARESRSRDALQLVLDDLSLALTTSSGLMALWMALALGFVVVLAERPLQRLTEHADALRRGEYVPIAPRGVFEARRIAESVSRLAAELKRGGERSHRNAALLAALSAGGTPAELSRRWLAALVADRGGAAALLWLVQEDGTLRRIAAANAMDADSTEGERLVHEVLADGKPRRFDDLGGAGFRVVRAGVAALAPTWLRLLPIQVGSRVLGVLEIAGGGPGEVAVDDEALATAASHLAIAIENALGYARTAELHGALAFESARLEAIVRRLPDAVLLADAEGRVLLANPASDGLFGPAPGRSLLEMAAALQVTDDVPSAPRSPEPARTWPPREEMRDIVRRIVDVQGVSRIVVVNVMPVEGDNGLRGIVVTARDETRSYELQESIARANEELRAQNEELRAQDEELRSQSEDLALKQRELAERNEQLAVASRLKSDFLASMSHELRTPLNAVIGFAELLLSDGGGLQGHRRRHAEDIHAAGRQLLTLINDVLDLSRIEAGRLELNEETVPVSSAVDEAVGLLRRAAGARNIVLSLDVAPELHVRADPDRVRQVLSNLLSNAIKFTPDGGNVSVSARVEESRVRVSVTDTGIGIRPEEGKRLFQPFSQAHSGYTRKFGGTGLGLAISKQLVEAMGGTIGFESTPGRGSTFHVTLPREQRASVRRSPEPPAREPVLWPGVARPLVLVVEDDEATRRMVRLLVEPHGYEVREAANAEDALSLVAAGLTPALWIIDLLLTGMDGTTLAEQLVRMGGERRPTILVLTSRDLEPLERETLARCGATVVQKGQLDRTLFLSRIAELCPPARAVRSDNPRRVLVVDDNELNRRVARAMLESDGHEVHEAADAEEGLRLALDWLPSIVLVDLSMPEIDGAELRRRLVANPRTASIPTIAFTAHAMAGDRDRLLAEGFDGYVSKPVGRAHLLAEVGRVLERRKVS